MTPKNKKILLGVLLVIFIIALIYFYTYFFAKKHGRVIYEDDTRRIYLTEIKQYDKRKDREMWRMVYEDRKTNKRYFILGNAKKGYSESEMCKRILNTIDQDKMSSYDQVDGVGVTIRKANTDIHSNLISKKGLEDLDKELGLNFI